MKERKELVFLGGVTEINLIRYARNIGRAFPTMIMIDYLAGLRDAGYGGKDLLLAARNAEFVTEEVVSCFENNRQPDIKIIDAITWSSGLMFLMKAMPRLSRCFGTIAAICPPIDVGQIRWNEWETSQMGNPYLAQWERADFWAPVHVRIASLIEGGAKIVAFLPPLNNGVLDSVEIAAAAARENNASGGISRLRSLGTKILDTACSDGRVRYKVGDIFQMLHLGIEIRYLPVQGHRKAIREQGNLAEIRAYFEE